MKKLFLLCLLLVGSVAISAECTRDNNGSYPSSGDRRYLSATIENNTFGGYNVVVFKKDCYTCPGCSYQRSCKYHFSLSSCDYPPYGSPDCFKKVWGTPGLHHNGSITYNRSTNNLILFTDLAQGPYPENNYPTLGQAKLAFRFICDKP